MNPTLPRLAALFAATLFTAACLAEPAAGAEEAGYAATVTAVADGDTVRVSDSHGRSRRVRLAYIDAPEMSQAGGTASRDALRQAVLGQKVRVEVFDTDQYRREVARISLSGRDVNLSQLANGHAWHYRSIARRRQDKADYARYAEAEQNARKTRSGLWRNSGAEAPWDYRRRERHHDNRAE